MNSSKWDKVDSRFIDEFDALCSRYGVEPAWKHSKNNEIVLHMGFKPSAENTEDYVFMTDEDFE